MEVEINIENIKEINIPNWYIDKAKNDYEAQIIAYYGAKYDRLGWTINDSKQYHMCKVEIRSLTGYGSENICRMHNSVKLSFEEFVKLAFETKAVKPKVEKQPDNESPLNIETIYKVLLKYIGEEEADDIIKELKQLK